MISRFLRPLLVCAAIGGLLIHRPDAVRAVSSGVVISQVYGGGGATTGSPTFKNDYIELFNRGNAPVRWPGCRCNMPPRRETSRRPPYCPA